MKQYIYYNIVKVWVKKKKKKKNITTEEISILWVL